MFDLNATFCNKLYIYFYVYIFIVYLFLFFHKTKFLRYFSTKTFCFIKSLKFFSFMNIDRILKQKTIYRYYDVEMMSLNFIQLVEIKVLFYYFKIFVNL